MFEVSKDLLDRQQNQNYYRASTMKLLVLADMHLDMHFADGVDPLERIPEDALHDITHCILAGDVSNKGHKRWNRCLAWIAERLPSALIFAMPGNHDYYDGCIDKEHKLRDAAAAHSVTFLQKSELIYGRHRFLCCTLWTDFEIYGEKLENLRRAAAHMNDHHFIRVARENYKKLTPVKTAQIHTDHRQWLEGRLSEAFDGETTVITHHAPHARALKGTPDIGPCYASDLEAMILEHQPERWLFGHTHHPVKFNVGPTALINISVGYPGQLPLMDSLDRFTFDLRE